MKEQIDILVRLQKVQAEAAEIQAALDQVPEKIKALEARQQDAEKAIADQSDRIAALSKTYRTLETDARQNQTQIEKSQDKLRSVKTNKEYQSSLKEIEDLKAINSRLEDEMLECLDQTDAAEKGLAEKNAAYQEHAKVFEDEKRDVERTAAEDAAKLAKLDIAEKEIAGLLTPQLLEVFNTVKKKQARGMAVVPVSNAICHGCNVALPPQRFNELQRGERLEFCPNCQRIIYWLDG